MNRHFNFYKVLLIFLILFVGFTFCVPMPKVWGDVKAYIISFISFLRLSAFLPFLLSIFFFLSNNFAQPKCDEFPYMIQIHTEISTKACLLRFLLSFI